MRAPPPGPLVLVSPSLTSVRRMDETQGSPEATSAFSALLRDLVRAPLVDGPDLVGVFTPGTRFGRFEAVREIGRGGFGVVLEARDPVLGRSVALKVIRPGRPGDVGSARLAEAEAIARLAHPNIVQLFDAGLCELGPYLVFELLRGETLLERLRRGPIPVAEAMRIGLAVARGLRHAHESGIVHRDLKPANVFLCADGQVKILDFGLALLVSRARKLEGGTPGWMAPEQRRGAPEDERTDVWALGALLFHSLSGEDPGSSRVELPDHPELAKVLEQMLEPDPVARPRDGAAVVKALEVLAGAAEAAGPAHPRAAAAARSFEVRGHARRVRRRNRALLLGAVALVALVSATVVVLKRHQGPPAMPERPLTLLVTAFHATDESVRSEAISLQGFVLRAAEKYLRPAPAVVVADDLPAPRTEREALKRAESAGADLVAWGTVDLAQGEVIVWPVLTASGSWEVPGPTENLQQVVLGAPGPSSLDRRREEADRLARRAAAVFAVWLAKMRSASAVAFFEALVPEDDGTELWMSSIRQAEVRAALRETSRIPGISWRQAVRLARAHLALNEPDLAIDTLAHGTGIEPSDVEVLRCHAFAAAARSPGGRSRWLPEVAASAAKFEAWAPPDAVWGALFAFVCRARAGDTGAAEALRARLSSFDGAWPAPAARWLLGEIAEPALLEAETDVPDPAGRRCEVNYYAGVGHLLRGGEDASAVAVARFREAIATGARGHTEYDLALLELRSLERAGR